MSPRDWIVDAALLSGALLAFVFLIAVAKMVVIYILCGLIFMAVAAYTVATVLARAVNHVTDLRFAFLPRSSYKGRRQRLAGQNMLGLCARVLCCSYSATGRCRLSLGRQRSR